MKKYVFVIITLMFLGTSAVVFGQSFNTEPSITITANPKDPEPGENVLVTLTSYETNLDLSYIKWFSGNETKSGYGEKSWIIKMGSNNGTNVTVSAEITLADGTLVTKEVSLSPREIDISWEAKDAKAPPFYLGKRIPIRENSIRVAAINQTTTGNKQIAYYWSRNGKALQSGSGAGKNFIDFKNTELEKSENIKVSMVSSDIQAERSLNIQMVNPKVLFYEYNPIIGLILNKNVTDSALGYDGTTSIYALPLGINTLGRKNTSWELSNTEVNNQENPYLLSFGVPDEKGIVPLNITIETLGTIYQEFFGEVRLNF